MSKEPAVIITAVTAFLAEVFGLCVAFGINISDSQEKAVIGTVTALAALIALLGPIIRQFVSSPHTVQRLVDNAQASGQVGSPPPPVPGA
jgi:hypothetical protein